jgi:MFS family permease
VAPGIGLPLKMLQWLSGSDAPSGLNEPKSASWHVLKQPRFLLHFGGSFVSNMGTWLQNTAQMLLAYQITHSAFAVGLVTSAQFSGFLVLGPWAAKLADILGSRRVLVCSLLVSAGIAGLMAYLQLHGTQLVLQQHSLQPR